MNNSLLFSFSRWNLHSNLLSAFYESLLNSSNLPIVSICRKSLFGLAFPCLIPPPPRTPEHTDPTAQPGFEILTWTFHPSWLPILSNTCHTAASYRGLSTTQHNRDYVNDHISTPNFFEQRLSYTK